MPSCLNPGRVQKLAIVAGYQKAERYGLLGPQMAATIIETYASCRCIVIAVPRDAGTALLKGTLKAYFEDQLPVIGFSNLGGRPDLFDLARDLKASGAVTVLAGPQAGVDFAGEVGWKDHPHRFAGVSDCFSFALQGPAEQIVPLILSFGKLDWHQISGLVYHGDDGLLFQNPRTPWNEKYLGQVNWENLYTVSNTGVERIPVEMGQVLQHIGCPHAARKMEIAIDYPVDLADGADKAVILGMRGCSFCDVAADKGFHGKLGLDTVVRQIESLPAGEDGKKIPFELINENPLPGLADLLFEVKARGISIRQVNLTLRADWLAAGESTLRAALKAAREAETAVMLSSIGFESFDDNILCNLNKGLTVEKNLAAIRLIRQLKTEYPDHLGYSRSEGAIHGFIHPTPWDTKATEASIQ